LHYGLRAVGERKLLLLLSDAALKDNVQQDIAQLFLEGLMVPSFNAFNNLVGLLKHIWDETGGGLLPVPRTALLRAQALDESHELEKRCTELWTLPWQGPST